MCCGQNLEQKLQLPPDARAAPLQAVHIIPFAMSDFEGQDERYQMSLVWANVYRYFPNLRSRLNFTPQDVNREDNIMMMATPLHEEFGNFRFVLEGTNTPDRYHIKLFLSFSSAYEIILPSNRYVMITSHDGRYPLPNPTLLAVNATIGNILHGAAGKKR